MDSKESCPEGIVLFAIHVGCMSIGNTPRRWLPKHELNKTITTDMLKRTEEVHEASALHKELQTRNPENLGNSLLQGRAQELVIQYQMANSENIHRVPYGFWKRFFYFCEDVKWISIGIALDL
ncbi:uncharacterized protein LOC143441153 [Arvicanthis niloticus]|uniref:uncharacterized protein LOC143311373 n=1 Tax=Arvicanthis niloticus TaxID=61156 RepID=UPI00402B22CB